MQTHPRAKTRLIFDYSVKDYHNTNLAPADIDPSVLQQLPQELLKKQPAPLPQVSELNVVRHYTALSQKNFSIDTHFYPLGSCTMKYNPRACNTLASQNEFLSQHPLSDHHLTQGFLSAMYELQQTLKIVTGMQAVSLSPMAGAQGEFAGVAMIRAYHDHHQDSQRSEIIVPDAAHGTNPATAVMCGYRIKEIPTNKDGDVDIEALKAAVGPQTAGIMLTNPSTLGVFEKRIKEIADIIHAAGGLLYYDGANLNAILGKVKPGDMGFDVIHMNLHKTFSTPHGGGGPGAGPIGVNHRLEPYMPVPVVARTEKDGRDFYYWQDETERPLTIGRLSAFMGNAGILMRAYIYSLLLGRQGLKRVAEFSSLNANYLFHQLKKAGFNMAFPERRASHEFILTLKQLTKETGVTAMDFAKRLLDYGVHAPTTYFPMLVPECFLIEPTETESQQTLDHFCEVMQTIMRETRENPELVKNAPHTLPVKRLDDVKAARELDLNYFYK